MSTSIAKKRRKNEGEAKGGKGGGGGGGGGERGRGKGGGGGGGGKDEEEEEEASQTCEHSFHAIDKGGVISDRGGTGYCGNVVEQRRNYIHDMAQQRRRDLIK